MKIIATRLLLVIYLCCMAGVDILWLVVVQIVRLGEADNNLKSGRVKAIRNKEPRSKAYSSKLKLTLTHAQVHLKWLQRSERSSSCRVTHIRRAARWQQLANEDPVEVPVVIEQHARAFVVAAP